MMFCTDLLGLSKIGKGIKTRSISPENPTGEPGKGGMAMPFKKRCKIPIKNMELMSLENRKEVCSFYDRCPYANDNCKS